MSRQVLRRQNPFYVLPGLTSIPCMGLQCILSLLTSFMETPFTHTLLLSFVPRIAQYGNNVREIFKVNEHFRYLPLLN